MDLVWVLVSVLSFSVSPVKAKRVVVAVREEENSGRNRLSSKSSAGISSPLFKVRSILLRHQKIRTHAATARLRSKRSASTLRSLDSSFSTAARKKISSSSSAVPFLSFALYFLFKLRKLNRRFSASNKILQPNLTWRLHPRHHYRHHLRPSDLRIVAPGLESH